MDASGTLVTGESFENAVELAHHLAESTKTHDCYTKQWSRVAFGQAKPDKDVLDGLQNHFMKKNGDVQKLLISIASSDAFRHGSGGTQ